MTKARIIFIPIYFLLACLVSGCATSAGGGNARTPTGGVVEDYLAALTRRDLLALTLYTTPDIEWYSALNGERILEVSGRDALEQLLRRYFSEHERTVWAVERVEIVDKFVAVIERSQWSEGSRMESRESLGVYEIDSGRIRRITYYLTGH